MWFIESAGIFEYHHACSKKEKSWNVDWNSRNQGYMAHEQLVLKYSLTLTLAFNLSPHARTFPTELSEDLTLTPTPFA